MMLSIDRQPPLPNAAVITMQRSTQHDNFIKQNQIHFAGSYYGPSEGCSGVMFILLVCRPSVVRQNIPLAR